MHAVERELIEASDFKPRKKYSDRQDYLKSLFLAVTKMDNDDFDELSDKAAGWANACVSIHNAKDNEDYPDFDEEDKYHEIDSTDAGDDTEAETASDEAEHEDDKDETEAEDDESEPDEDEAEDAEDDEDVDTEDEEGDPTDDNPEDEGEEDEPEPEPKPKKPPTKNQAKRLKENRKVPKPTKKPPKHNDDEDAVLDKWGCIEGSKNAQALALFEKGATTKEVREKIGGTYYNILGKMVKNGHTVNKDGAVISLVHKDEVKKSSKAPAKKKK